MSVCQSSRVQLLKNRFESLNSSPVTIRDDTSVGPPKPKVVFQRSKTSLQLSQPRKEPLKQVKSAPRQQQPPRPRPLQRQQLGQASGAALKTANTSSSSSSAVTTTAVAEIPPKEHKGAENKPFLRQTDDIRRASIKRSPAFRERSSQRVKSSAPNPPIAQSKPSAALFDQQVEEAIRRNPNVNLTDTLKKALCQPLPLGPPPKKPPRASFDKPLPPAPSESPPPKIEVIQISSKPSNGSATAVRQVASDKISTFVDNNFLSCFSCAVKEPIYDAVAREPIYMQPFGHLKKDGIGNGACASKHNDDNSTDLHYMCTSISDSYPTEDERSMSSITTYDQINLLVDAAFCEINQLSDELEEEERQKKAQMARLTRSLTEKRKDYVRRTVTNREKYKKDVRSIYGTVHKGFQLTDIATEAGVDASSIVPISERLSRYKELMEASTSSETNKSPTKTNNNHPESLFQVCLLIGFNITTNQPYVRWKFPMNASAPDNVEEMVFPSKDMLMHTDQSNQNFSLVFTDLDGNRLYGFCRRVLPEGSQVFLPLVYCMVTTHLAPDFYFKILQEVEVRHGHSDTYTNSMLKSLHPMNIPHAGDTLSCPLPELPQPAAILTHANRHSKRLSLELNPKWLSEVRLEASRQAHESKKSGSAELPDIDNTQLVIRRPKDLRLEHSEISELHRWLGPELLVAVFGTLLHERKVIFYSRNINKLSSCVLGLHAILYPFTWQYPMITVLPDHIMDICQAPIPIIIGCMQEVHVEIEDGIVVNLDTKKAMQQCGDENMILPDELRQSLQMSLDLVDMLNQGKTLSNVLIAEAFLRFFVELLQGFDVQSFEVNNLLVPMNYL